VSRKARSVSCDRIVETPKREAENPVSISTSYVPPRQGSDEPVIQACAQARRWLVEANGLPCPDPQPLWGGPLHRQVGWRVHGTIDPVTRGYGKMSKVDLPGNGNSCENNSMSQKMTRMARQSHGRREYEACA